MAVSKRYRKAVAALQNPEQPVTQKHARGFSQLAIDSLCVATTIRRDIKINIDPPDIEKFFDFLLENGFIECDPVITRRYRINTYKILKKWNSETQKQ